MATCQNGNLFYMKVMTLEHLCHSLALNAWLLACKNILSGMNVLYIKNVRSAQVTGTGLQSTVVISIVLNVCA